jgi:hypothetical protein
MQTSEKNVQRQEEKAVTEKHNDIQTFTSPIHEIACLADYQPAWYLHKSVPWACFMGDTNFFFFKN